MKLRTKKSHFQNLPEGKAPRRILPALLKLAYYLLLLGILGGLSYVAVMRYIYFTGRGQVEIEKIKISSDHGGRIKSIDRQIGDTFSAGDILAVIDTGIICPGKTPDTRVIRLAYDIKLKQSGLELYSKQLKELEKEGTGDLLLRALEIGDSFTRRRNRETGLENERLREKIDLLAAEIAIKRNELSAIKKELAVERNAVCGVEIIRSSFAGSVYHVIRQPSEYVKRGMPLFIVIPKGANVGVEAFFDRKHMRSIAKCRTMVIEFPDHTTSLGEIIDYPSSAKYAADRTQKDYLPIEAKLRVNLKPVLANDSTRWKRYDRMDVVVKGER